MNATAEINSAAATSEAALVGEALQSALERFKPPATWLHGGLAIVDGQGRYISVNEALAQWLGQPVSRLPGAPFAQTFAKAAPEWGASLVELLQDGSPFVQAELAAPPEKGREWLSVEIARHGDTRFVRLNSMLPPLVELEETAWDEHLRSDAARRHLFVRLLRAEAQLENLVSRWPGVIFSQRADLSFNFASSRIEELTGVPVEEWRRQPGSFWKIVHEADTEELEQELRRLRPNNRSHTGTFRIRHARTGRVSYVLEHREAIFSANGLLLGYEGAWVDVTRQAIAEKRLSSAAWKETLAVLTMGRAHDFGNLLAGIHSLSEVFHEQIEAEHPFREGIALIRRNSMEASQLVRRILSLHKGEVGEDNYYNLNELVTDTLELTRKMVPHRIQIETRLASEPLPIFVDAVEFRRVLINLTLNAVDAMPQGGTLFFETSRHEQSPLLAHAPGAPPRPGVCLAVRDTGCGISARHLDAIFDPFFTTKVVIKGSGLGLYNARLFAEKHSGAITAESVEGNGATFRIWLPQADFTESERQQDQAGSRRHTLLLHGPRGDMLERTAEFLRQNGLYVVTATAEATATELLVSPDYQFAAVMCLAHAGECSGPQLLADARSAKPPIKTVLQAFGSNLDELDTSIVCRADLILPPDASAQEIITRLKSLLDATTPPYP